MVKDIIPTDTNPVRVRGAIPLKDRAPAEVVEVAIDVPNYVFAYIRKACQEGRELKCTFIEKQYGDRAGERITSYAHKLESNKS